MLMLIIVDVDIDMDMEKPVQKRGGGKNKRGGLLENTGAPVPRGEKKFTIGSFGSGVYFFLNEKKDVGYSNIVSVYIMNIAYHIRNIITDIIEILI